MDRPPDPQPAAAVARWWTPDAPRWLTESLRFLALGLFAAPLFVGLGLWDLRNDEAIYSYAVDRMIDTGDWVTPLSIPTDYWFVEKPPLKFWIVGGAMAAGLTPRNEIGMRFFDALFGAIAFGYVFALGRRLAGPACGFVAVLVLFTFDPLVFDHGLRTNNMEAPLTLAYAGGMFHIHAWLTGDARRRRLHAWIATGYVVLGFMTKFVAVAFLPLAVLAAVGWQGGRWAYIRAHWRDWLAPALAAVVFSSPWFIYHTWLEPREFWNTIFGAHVYTRFTSHLDPSHLHPWHYYFTTIWREFGYAQSQLIVGGGAVWLAWRAWTGQPWLARLVLAWWVVPLALMSLMTSKLIHYAYPFVLPMAIAAGGAVTAILRLISGVVAAWVADRAARASFLNALRQRPACRGAAMGLAGLAVIVSVATLLNGEPLTLPPGDNWVFRNSSVLRPLVIAGLLLALAGRATFTVHVAAVLMVQFLLPWPTYDDKVAKAQWENRPLMAIRDCAREQLASGKATRPGLFITDAEMVMHPYSYYLRPLGPWTDGLDALESEARTRLFEPGQQTPVILTFAEAKALRSALDLPARSASDLAVSFGHPDIAAVTPYQDFVVLLPGPFRSCAAPAIAAGAVPIEDGALR